MDITGIKKEIDRIGKMIEGWDSAVSDIERGIVLDKLKTLYEEVMFWGQGQPAHTGATVQPASSADAAQAHPDSGEAQPEAETAAPPEPAFEFLGTVTAEDETAQATGAGEPAVTIRAHAPEADLEAEEEARRPMRRPLQKEIIRSLYGDEPLSDIRHNTVPEEADDSKIQDETTQELSFGEISVEIQETSVEMHVEASTDNGDAPASSTKATDEAAAQHDRQKKNIHSSKNVLGEVIGINTRPTIGESIGTRSSKYDTVAKMQASNHDLRHSIGINDKFTILRDLFAGNNARYKEVIDRLGEFTSLDDAMIYIQESHGDWNPDCEGVKIIVDLLTKRLG